MLLKDLERAEARSANLEGYIERFHQSEKRAAVLEEKLKSQNSFEVLYAFGIGVGSALMGIAPSFWTEKNLGPALLALGIALTVGSLLARWVRK